jgi:hypothetical protein
MRGKGRRWYKKWRKYVASVRRREGKVGNVEAMVQEIAEICSIGVQKDRKDGNVEAMVQEMMEICSNGAEMGVI